MRNHITKLREKTIQKAIRNRDAYLRIVDTDPKIRAIQIRAMKTAFIDSQASELECKNVSQTLEHDFAVKRPDGEDVLLK
jgi:hypothetical protein